MARNVQQTPRVTMVGWGELVPDEGVVTSLSSGAGPFEVRGCTSWEADIVRVDRSGDFEEAPPVGTDRILVMYNESSTCEERAVKADRTKVVKDPGGVIVELNMSTEVNVSVWSVHCRCRG